MDACAQEPEAIDSYLRCFNDPYASFARIVLSFPRDHNACFLLCNAGTKASEHEGISAAGCTPLARRLTPALDAEALVLGKTLSEKSLPLSPAGIVSPVVISRACLTLLKMDIQVIDCGSFSKARLNHLQISDRVAECPSSGSALPAAHVQELFRRGLQMGEELSRTRSHLLVAECVPGGTTTAMALLTALGYQVTGLVSSSLPAGNHEARRQLVLSGLSKCKYSAEEMRSNPLLAVAAVGDPMQAFAAGIALGTAGNIPVFLAGGSQMLAVWALLRALAPGSAAVFKPENIMVLTTRWVACDRQADVLQLAQMLAAPFAAACPNFYDSEKPGLQAYEEGNVKEGVGAGACLCLARAAGFDSRTIMKSIDACYDELVS